MTVFRGYTIMGYYHRPCQLSLASLRGR